MSNSGDTRDICTQPQDARTSTGNDSKFDRFETIVQALPAAIWAKTVTGQYIFANHAFRQNFAEYLGDRSITHFRDEDFFTPADAALFAVKDQEIIARNAAEQFVESVNLPAGRKHVLTIKFPLPDVHGKPYASCGMSVDITESVQQHERLLLENSQLALRDRQLLMLTRSPVIDAGDTKASLHLIAAAAAEGLSVSRVSIWLWDEQHETLTCHTLHQDGEANTQGVDHPLRRIDYPRYIGALDATLCLAIDDVANDPNTSELIGDYLQPHGISSMLDTSIRLAGKSIGVLCCEHLGPARHWDKSEVVFAAALADMVGRAFIAERRRQSENELRRLNQQLQHRVEHETRATERATIESQHSRQQLQDIADHMPGGVFQMHWQSRNEMHFLYISKGVMRMTGLAMADFTDVPPRALSAVCPDDLPDLLERVYAVALNPDEVIDHRFRIYDPQGGDWLWLEVKARCRPAEGGGMLFNGSFTDVTENQRLKNAVAESERLLKAAFSGSTDGVWEWCCDSDRLYYSPRLFEMLGYADQAMPYHIDTFLKLCHPDDAGVTQAMLRAATQSKRDGPFHAEYRMRAADGSWRWIMGRGAVTQRDPNGRVLRFTGTNTDIQAQKELEARLSEARATAQQASQAKGEFLANMSHEIRTPMNAVVGLTALLSGTPLNARQQSYLQKLRGASESLMSLINNVLDLSKIEAGKLQIENMPFELGEVMERQQALLTEQAATKGLLLSFPTSLPETGQLLGDPVRLGQILLNLVGNAIKFTERGHVTVQVTQLACTVDRVTLRFTVIDTGIGIPPEVAKNLFNPFTQAAPSTTRRFGGTGLGLSICQQLVALMNGEMGLESTPTQGSRFWFTADFGLASTSESPAVKLRSHDSNEVLEGLRVLVAEDNDINMEIITELLQQVGVRVQGAGNGRDAVDACMANRPDVVLMDMQMPEMDGLSATTALRKHPGLADLPIIALTANAMTEDRERCLAAGMNDYLSKPIDLDELYALLRRWRPREEPLP